MIRTITGCLSMIVIGLILMSCSSRVAQLTEEEKRYADDLSFCRASTMERPEPPEMFAQCMASRGWREKVPVPPPRPRLTP
jgi:hypothetical protein